MKRPSIPYKPPAPSIHPLVGRAVERARRLPAVNPTEAELVADIERDLGLQPGWLDANSGPKVEGK